MGQICIAKPFRSRGLFADLYAAHRRAFVGRYQLLVTEISARNGRSLRAQERVGFATLGEYEDELDTWRVVALQLY